MERFSQNSITIRQQFLRKYCQDAFKERGKGFESEYMRKQSKKLLKELRKKQDVMKKEIDKQKEENENETIKQTNEDNEKK